MFESQARLAGRLPSFLLVGMSILGGQAWAADDGNPLQPRSPSIVIEAREVSAAATEEDRASARLSQLLTQVREAAGGATGYWIGAAVEPVNDAARANREIPAGQGLVVESVVPDSPAAKSGLAQGDILLAGRDKPLNNREQLAAMIAEGKDDELPLQILRGKERKSITIRPAKRAGEGQVFVISEEEEQAGKELRKIIERSRLQPAPAGQPLNAWGTPYRPLPGQPGAPLPQAAVLPDDMQITIKKNGNKPARVQVKQGEKSWRTTENELGMLPPAAQAYAAKLLGRPASPWQPQTSMMPGAPLGEVHRKRLALDEKGQPRVQKVDGQPGGIQIEIREGADQPARRIQWQELKRPQPAAEPSPEARRSHEIHELREQLERLTRKLEELQKGEKRP